jgi:SAM-dependent methyltransferase
MKSQIKEIKFICISCSSVQKVFAMFFTEEYWVCPNCQMKISIHDNDITLNSWSEESVNSDLIFRFKMILKKVPKISMFVGHLIGPILADFKIEVSRTIREFQLTSNPKIVNLGSGTSDYGKDVINVDFIRYKNVDLVLDICNLPFENDQFDLVVLTEVLEHIENPTTVIKEAHRILKRGGSVLITSPFMIGFHASPNDFQRFTIPGLKYLLKSFTILKIKSYGPTGSLMWIFQEWLALWLSFGSKKLHMIWLLFFMIITSPIKLLDVVLNHNPLSSNIASTYFILAKKN